MTSTTTTSSSSNQQEAVQNLFGAASVDSPPKSMSFNKNTSWKSQHENDGLSKYGGRDLVGFGHKPPCPKWPGGAKLVRRILECKHLVVAVC
jgi:hypothetical protein